MRSIMSAIERNADMIAGNPNSARKACIVAVCFFLLLLATAGYLAWRRKTAPEHING